MKRIPRRTLGGVGLLALLFSGCGGADESTPAAEAPPASGFRAAPPAPDDLDRALLLTLSVFPKGPDGKASKTPGPATLLILRREGGAWVHEVVEDPESNVFHKARVFAPPGAEPGILTLGGTGARLKLWRRSGPDRAWTASTLWAPEFGGKWDRLRDLDLADLDGDGILEIALATHDQGVIAVVEVGEAGVEVSEVDREPDTFVHELESGDVDGDGRLELFTTPSQPNRFDGTAQRGRVMRYRPERTAGEPGAKEVFADLGDRHAKEVLVADLQGDGRPEVYVSVEGRVEKGVRVQDVEIRRYGTGGEGDAGEVVARIDDFLCRFLVPADIDGDGKLEIVAAPFKAGLRLLRPGPGEWSQTLIDADSSGFEHAAAAFDLDGDGRDEIYVAADDQSAVRRYVWLGDGFGRDEIFQVPDALHGFTWGVAAAPTGLVR
jgi:hypothetical protein